MFGWFKHVPKIEHQHSEWTCMYKCHCGELYTKDRHLCVECGCDDLITKVIGRWEWDKDVNARGNDWFIGNAWEDSNCFNAKFVEKPEGCQKSNAIQDALNLRYKRRIV